MRMKLIDFLQQRYPQASRTTLRQMLAEGRVLINNLPARTAGRLMEPADQVRVLSKSDRSRPVMEAAPPSLPFPVVHEDEDLIIINKPPGLLTSTHPGERRPTAWAMIRDVVHQGNPRARVGLIHRLDRDASGLLVFSKNDQAYQSLKRQLKARTIRRIYLALCTGVPTPLQGVIRSRLVELPDGRVRTSRRPGAGEEAITHYEVIDRFRSTGKKGGMRSVLRVRLHTGRKHQIRAHLEERGHPILNDPLYAGEKPDGRLMLVAVQLGLIHPRTGLPLEVQIDPPPEFLQVSLRRADPDGRSRLV
jgi:23S rRNA pseudouridine1911/1915/1917 synthase